MDAKKVLMLNFKHLHYFVSVAREGGIIRASERLHLAPQTLSVQISQLEERIGVALFNRTGRRMELTPMGKLALSYAEEIFQTGTELEEILRQGGEERFVTFRVGISDVVPKFVAHRLLAPVLNQPEAVRLVCHEDRLERLLAEMAIHRLDMVLADRPMPPGTEIKGYSHPLGESAVAFMASPELAGKLKGQFPENLDGQPLLLPGKDSALMKAFGEGGAGVFPAASASLPDIVAHYEVEQIGMIEDIHERYFLISPERRLKHPAARAVSDNARSGLFAASS